MRRINKSGAEAMKGDLGEVAVPSPVSSRGYGRSQEGKETMSMEEGQKERRELRRETRGWVIFMEECKALVL